MATKNNLQQDEFIKRLLAQSRHLEGDPSKYLFDFGLQQGMLALEVGSCIGLHSGKVAKAIYPGKLLSMDLDYDYISYQKNYMVESEIKICPLNGDALSIPVANGRFDFIYSRFLFQHLANPRKALEETYRVLKVGGRVVVIDTDDYYDTFYPELPCVTEAYSALARLQEGRCGDRYIGRKLVSLMLETGFKDVEVRIVPTVQIGMWNKELVLNDIALMFREEYEPLINQGLISKEHLDSAITAMLDSVNRTNSFYMGLVFIVCGTKNSY